MTKCREPSLASGHAWKCKKITMPKNLKMGSIIILNKQLLLIRPKPNQWARQTICTFLRNISREYMRRSLVQWIHPICYSIGIRLEFWHKHFVKYKIQIHLMVWIFGTKNSSLEAASQRTRSLNLSLPTWFTNNQRPLFLLEQTKPPRPCYVAVASWRYPAYWLWSVTTNTSDWNIDQLSSTTKPARNLALLESEHLRFYKRLDILCDNCLVSFLHEIDTTNNKTQFQKPICSHSIINLLF